MGMLGFFLLFCHASQCGEKFNLKEFFSLTLRPILPVYRRVTSAKHVEPSHIPDGRFGLSTLIVLIFRTHHQYSENAEQDLNQVQYHNSGNQR